MSWFLDLFFNGTIRDIAMVVLFAWGIYVVWALRFNRE